MSRTMSDGDDVDVCTPGPLHWNVLGAPPPIHVAVNSTDPPPTGNEAGVEVTAQRVGGWSVLTGTVTDAAVAAPLPFDAITVNVEVALTLARLSDADDVEVETPGPLHAKVV